MRAAALPAGFRVRFTAAFGAAAWTSYSAALDGQPACRGLRLHRHKLARIAPGAAWVDRLYIRLGPPVPWARDAYYLEAGDRLGNDPLHAAGLFYIQEPSAMAPVALLDVRPGERALDLCAAPGGKTTQIGAAMAGEGLLVANEPDAGRAVVLAENVERAGLANCIVTHLAPERLAQTYAGFFDAVLVDAPCSGEGLFRRQPEASAMWSDDLVAFCAARQLAILQSAVAMLRPGGRLVYSTCTLNPLENEQVVARLLALCPRLRLERAELPGAVPGLSAAQAAAAAWWSGLPGSGTGTEAGSGADPGAATEVAAEVAAPTERCLRYFPHTARAEGHFAALFTLPETEGQAPRTVSVLGASGPGSGRARDGSTRHPELQTKWRQFAAAILDDGWLRHLSRRATVLSRSDILYAAPDAPLPDRGVLRCGLPLAAMPHRALLPEHGLALVPGSSHRALCLAYGDPRILEYLAGAEISLTPEEQRAAESPDAGFCLVTIDGLALGWGKRVGGRVKNHYPRGLRRAYEFTL